jgi:hypothetical protein
MKTEAEIREQLRKLKELANLELDARGATQYYVQITIKSQLLEWVLGEL